jgi:uncharacterized protein (DUF1778 family)
VPKLLQPMPERRTTTVRLAPKERAMIAEAAAQREVSMTAFLRLASVEAAARVLGCEDVIRTT